MCRIFSLRLVHTHPDRATLSATLPSAQLLPLLADYCPDAFVRGYLASCLEYLIETLRAGHIRDAAYLVRS
jgi:hypothetical protein